MVSDPINHGRLMGDPFNSRWFSYVVAIEHAHNQSEADPFSSLEADPFSSLKDRLIEFGSKPWSVHGCSENGCLSRLTPGHCANKYRDLLPLARYIAWSALLIKASTVVPSFGNIEIPILALMLGLMVRSPILTSHGV